MELRPDVDVGAGRVGWGGEVLAGFEEEDEARAEAETEGEEGEWTALGCVKTVLVVVGDAVVMVEFL